MDILVSRAYLRGMFARVVTMLAALAIAVMTMASAAHAMRMDAMPLSDHAVHVDEGTHAVDIVEVACDGEDPCGPGGGGMCDVVCAGLSALPISPGGDAPDGPGAAAHGLPSGAIHASRAPALTEHPPKHRLA